MTPKILGGSWYTSTMERMRLNPSKNSQHPILRDSILGFRCFRSGRQSLRA